MTISMLLRCALLTLLVAALGCGNRPAVDPNRPKVVPVTGVVTYKQSPVEGATVVFRSGGGTPGAAGRTDAQGRFRLRTFDPDDGAVPGSYQVLVTKFESRPEKVGGGDADGDGDGVDPKSLLPDRYQDPKRSGLTAEVSDGGDNNFTFELKD